MKIFVAGGTGVLGRASIKSLVEAGHQVRATARTALKASLVLRLGAEPVKVDLFDPPAVREAIADYDAVLRLTTRIPALAQVRDRSAWRETNRLRREGARVLVDAAISAGAKVYVHESVVFVYADAGTQWITEDAPAQDGGSGILRAALDGEREAARFSASGGRGVVLRFGAFYGADAPSTAEVVSGMRRRMIVQAGAGENFLSSIYVPDAGCAVRAALGIPGGTYNVVEDDPVRFRDYLRALADAVHTPRPMRVPAAFGRLMFGEVWNYFSRSLRVSNSLLKKTSDWQPSVPSVREGWPLVAAEMDGKKTIAA
jgi:nucleoside-diphosphate-sugar epimerase